MTRSLGLDLLAQKLVPHLFNNKRLVQELFYQLEKEEISFYEAPHLYDITNN